ncbi:MAG: phosphatase PAP2 family protein [Candidatus Peribacteria bacterium]|nr:MAG: phosphatase PAP2 family protein [Candidatus Peribacteria bacterium]
MGRGRIAIAIHWPTDILAGFTIGIIIAWITTRPSIQKRLQPLRNSIIKMRNSIIGIFHKPTK